jgi:hypothetical protein
VAVEPVPLASRHIDDQRLAHQPQPGHAQQVDCGLVGLPDQAAGVGHQVAVRGELKQVPVAAALDLDLLAASQQLLVLLVQLLSCHLELLDADRERFQDLVRHLAGLGWQVLGAVGELLQALPGWAGAKVKELLGHGRRSSMSSTTPSG